MLFVFSFRLSDSTVFTVCQIKVFSFFPQYDKKFVFVMAGQAGMTLAIEPMINAGGYDVVGLDDDWTVVTEDGSLSAHYENTVLITDGEPEILSLPK